MLRLSALWFVTVAMAGAAWAQTVLCTEEFAAESWDRTFSALDVDDGEAAAAEIDALLLVCEESPLTYVPRVLRSEYALEVADFELARRLLAPLPETYDTSIAAHAGWLKMLTFQALGDEAALRATRSGVIAASHAFLADPDGGASGRHLETWDTESETVHAYKTRLPQARGSFLRRYFFLIEPKNATLPQSVTITNSAATSLLSELGLDSDRDLEEPTQLAVDGYECGWHYTLDWIDSELDENGPTVSYETARAAIQPMLNRQRDADPISGSGDDEATALTRCSMSGYITPVEAE